MGQILTETKDCHRLSIVSGWEKLRGFQWIGYGFRILIRKEYERMTLLRGTTRKRDWRYSWFELTRLTSTQRVTETTLQKPPSFKWPKGSRLGGSDSRTFVFVLNTDHFGRTRILSSRSEDWVLLNFHQKRLQSWSHPYPWFRLVTLDSLLPKWYDIQIGLHV